mgnify:CR=1 FL=1
MSSNPLKDVSKRPVLNIYGKTNNLVIPVRNTENVIHHFTYDVFNIIAEMLARERYYPYDVTTMQLKDYNILHCHSSFHHLS